MDYILSGKLFCLLICADLPCKLILGSVKKKKIPNIYKTSERVYAWHEKHSMDIILAMDPDGDLLQLSNQKDFYAALR